MSGPPLAIVVAGPPGVGKSCTGRHLAARLGASLLDLDTMTNPLVDVIADLIGVEGDYADPQLAGLVREPRYACLVQAAGDCLGAGSSVVLVAPFTQERNGVDAWGRLASRLRAAGGEPHLVWLRADAELIAQRMAGRGAARDKDKLAGLRDGLAVPDLTAPTVPYLAVEASLTPEEQASTLISALGAS